MKLGNKTYNGPTNLVKAKCPLDGKALRYKPPCCSERYAWLVCPCGYKRRINTNDPNDFPLHFNGSFG